MPDIPFDVRLQFTRHDAEAAEYLDLTQKEWQSHLRFLLDEYDRLRAEVEALRKGPSVKDVEHVLLQADAAFRPGEAVIGPNRASFLVRALLQALGRDAG